MPKARFNLNKLALILALSLFAPLTISNAYASEVKETTGANQENLQPKSQVEQSDQTKQNEQNTQTNNKVEQSIDLSLPVNYQRCQQVDLVKAYVESLDRADSVNLQKALDFLYGCRQLVTQLLEQEKKELERLESLEKTEAKK